MTTDDPRPPRVGVALPAGELREKLLASLRGSEVEIEQVPRGADVWEGLEDQEVDVLVVRRSQLPSSGLDPAATEAGPGIVVVSEGEDLVERAELLALGARRVLDAAESPERLAQAVEVLAEAEQRGASGSPERTDSDGEPRLADFLSRSPYMRKFLDTVRKVTDATASLLITGETGVGKERLARAIHAESDRSDGPFVAVNCGALPEQLLESELFGHEKGAFTGADARRAGRFEQADGGTILLDEIGEMPAHLQVKLLTVLQRGEVQRVGGTEPVSIDVRVMAATNRNVEEDVREGRFREDLFYRLNVIRLEVPSLRERIQDLPDLVGLMIRHFRQGVVGKEVETISEEAMAALNAHDWPGNMRELINVIERAVLLTDGVEIGLAALPEALRGASSAPTPGSAGLLPRNWESLTIKEVREHAICEVEREYLDRILEATRGRVNETAERAGIGVRALHNRMRKLGLRKEDYR